MKTLIAASIIWIFSVGISSLTIAESVPRSECFPIEKLAPELQPKAEALLLKMMDSEALYTIIGDLKPVSSSFWNGSFSLAEPNLVQLSETRQILHAFRSGNEFSAEILVFAKAQNGKKLATAWVANNHLLDQTIASHAAFYSHYGITEGTPAVTIIEKMEHADRLDRLRASGYQYGYPDYAVDFFVNSEKIREASDDKKLVPRDFVSAPTFASPTNRFVWAIPKGSSLRPEDHQIISKAKFIFAEYTLRREQYIGEGRRGIVALIRDWFDDGQGNCSSAHALQQSSIKSGQVSSRALALGYLKEDQSLSPLNNIEFKTFSGHATIDVRNNPAKPPARQRWECHYRPLRLFKINRH